MSLTGKRRSRFLGSQGQFKRFVSYWLTKPQGPQFAGGGMIAENNGVGNDDRC
jgi:hypothetical protein